MTWKTKMIAGTFTVMLLAAVISPVAAQVEQVTLRVDGLACPFCAYGLEKKITKQEGYASSEVRINEGEVIVHWRDDQPLDLNAIHEAVKKAGFTLRGVRGRFVGSIVRDDEGRYFLELPDPPAQRFYLYETAASKNRNDGDDHQNGDEADDRHDDEQPDHDREATADAFSDACRERLDRAAEENATVRIVGPVHRHENDDLPTAIGIETLERVTAPATQPDSSDVDTESSEAKDHS